jgi:hypothetical protein
MGDTIRNDAAHEWRQLCQAAFFELDPIKLLERTVDARNAVPDGIEDTEPRFRYPLGQDDGTGTSQPRTVKDWLMREPV